MSIQPYEFQSHALSTTFPFEPVKGGAFFQVHAQKSGPLWFLIDSGSGATYLDTGVARRIGLQSQGKTQVQGAGEGKVEVDIYPEVDFQLPGLLSRGHRVHGISFSGVSRQWGRPLQGLFGHDFLSRFSVTINYPRREIRVEEASRFNYSGPGTPIPLEFKGPLPFARATIHVRGNPPLEDLFLVDTGSQDEVDHPLIARSSSGTQPTTGGVGLGAPTRAVLGRVEVLELGPVKIQGATGVASESGLGSRLIGSGVLSHFKVIFDYQRNRMIIEPEARRD